jgi:hypothetical protein
MAEQPWGRSPSCSHECNQGRQCICDPDENESEVDETALGMDICLVSAIAVVSFIAAIVIRAYE